MSQSEQILLFASAVGAKCKELNAHIGALSGLSTQAKTSLVAALNEVNAALGALTGTVGTNGTDIAQLKLDVDAVEAAVEASVAAAPVLASVLSLESAAEVSSSALFSLSTTNALT